MGSRIKELRLERGLTQEELGKIAGVKKAAVQKWESGMTTNLRRDVIQRLSTFFDVSPSYLMGMTDIKKSITVKTKKIPLLGEIAAGEPILAFEDCKTYVEIDGYCNVDFCLKIKGDSMIDARINNGDIVFVRQQPIVENGEIAVVLLDNEATLKRFYRNDNGVILKPENKTYHPRFYTEEDFKDIKVLGKAVFFQSLL